MALKEGRELDTAVHQAVTGEKSIWVPPGTYFGAGLEHLNGDWASVADDGTRCRLPRYHADDAALMAAVDRLVAQGWSRTVEQRWDRTWVQFRSQDQAATGEHPDRRTAICRAIAALGGE